MYASSSSCVGSIIMRCNDTSDKFSYDVDEHSAISSLHANGQCRQGNGANGHEDVNK